MAFPGLGMYNASKWALEGMAESLAQEMAPFNVKVTIVEPGGFETYWDNDSIEIAERLPEYLEAFGPAEKGRQLGDPERRRMAGDPRKAARALLAIVESDNPPLRVLWGNVAYDRATTAYVQRLAVWAEWEHLSRSTDFDE